MMSGRLPRCAPALLLALALAPRGASGAAPLTLEEAVSLALRANPALRAATAAAEASREQIGRARSQLFPRIDLAHTATRSDNPVYVFGTLLQQQRFTEADFALDRLNHPDPINNFETAFQLRQVLVSVPVVLDLHAARLGHDMGVAARDASQMELIFETLRAYFAARLAIERMRVTTEAGAAAASGLERSRALRDAGMATDADVLALQVHAAALKEDTVRADAQRKIAAAELNRAMGQDLDAEYELVTRLEPTGESAMGAAVEPDLEPGHPRLREAELALDMARLERRKAKSGFLPELALVGGLQWDEDTLFGDGGSSWMAGVALRLNLFSGLGRRAGLRAAAAEERRFEASVADARGSLELEVRKAALDLEASVQRVAVSGASVAEAREVDRIVESRYEAGLTTVTELLRSHVARLGAELRLQEALFARRMAEARLELARGALSADSEVIRR